MWMEHIMFRNRYVHTNAYLFIITINKEKVMKLKKIKEAYMGGKGREGCN